MLEGECRIYKHSGTSMRTFVFRIQLGISFYIVPSAYLGRGCILLSGFPRSTSHLLLEAEM
jgi:hypothetical protein